MQFDARLTGEAAALAREHGALLRRLPATIHAFILGEIQKWPTLFAPERRYQQTLLELLSGLSDAELAGSLGKIARIESETGIPSFGSGDPARFQDEAQGRLRSQRRVQEWRTEVDRFFKEIDPALEARLYPPDVPRRLVVQIYANTIAVQNDRLWSRFKGSGLRVPLALDARGGPDTFLRALFGGSAGDQALPALFAAAKDSAALEPLDLWLIESHDSLHKLLESAPVSSTRLSFDRLRAYRDELTRALYAKIKSGVESPQAFAAYARSLKIAPGVMPSEVLQAFVRDVFLTGNGTLFVNNTFVEWAAVQTLRRAQPRILVTRFGVRDKLKPFSSLLLFSQPRASDQIPMIEDPVGSFVDVEQLTYYVWLNAEKSPAYRRKTLYLFLAEGIEEMLAIRSDVPDAPAATLPTATLADVCATMAHWFGVANPAITGRPIAPLVVGR
jgi:hypothetical protein